MMSRVIRLQVNLVIHRETVGIAIQMTISPPHPCVKVMIIIFMGKRHVVMTIVIVMMKRRRMRVISFLTLTATMHLPFILILRMIVKMKRKAAGARRGVQVQVDSQT